MITKKILALIVLAMFTAVVQAQTAPAAAPAQARAPYVVQYVEVPPYGVSSWVNSDRLKKGIGNETTFVPYSSESAQNLWLDATTVRDVVQDKSQEGRKTLFNMAYNTKGWYVYIQTDEPDIQDFVDKGRDIAIELFFVPGMENVPYYQMIINQLKKSAEYYDWGMPSRDYRSLDGRIVVESMVLDGGAATFMFIPWDVLYDQSLLINDQWRFSFMRWGGTSVTWGGKVHDTGNFGKIKFEKPSAKVAAAIRKNNLRKAWFTFQKTVAHVNEHWTDAKMGDIDFYNKALKPAIARYQALGEALGEPNRWSDDVANGKEELTKNLMEFDYEVQALRSEYLKDKIFGSAK